MPGEAQDPYAEGLDILALKYPERIQRRRTKGWRMPPNSVVISRPGEWSNPFRLSSRQLAIQNATITFRT